MAKKPLKKKIEKKAKAVTKKAASARKSAAKKATKVGKTVRKKASSAGKSAKKKAATAGKSVKKKAAKKKVRSRAKAAGVAVAGVAGIAGIAAALHLLRRDSKGRARLHVRTEGDSWVVAAEGKKDALGRFSTKEEAVDAGRDAAQKAAPSELVIHRLDGSVMRTHSYEPA